MRPPKEELDGVDIGAGEGAPNGEGAAPDVPPKGELENGAAGAAPPKGEGLGADAAVVPPNADEAPKAGAGDWICVV